MLVEIGAGIDRADLGEIRYGHQSGEGEALGPAGAMPGGQGQRGGPSVNTPPMQAFPAERAVPFYCPYCGEEDLEPQEADGEWRCRSCVRLFRLRFAGSGAIR